MKSKETIAKLRITHGFRMQRTHVLTTYKFPFAQKPSHGVLFRPNERRRATAKSLTNAAEEFSSITN